MSCAGHSCTHAYRGLTFTPSLTRLCTWLGFSGALLSQTLVSSLRMANTLPRPHPPPFRVHQLGVDERGRWSRGILLWLTNRHSALLFFAPHFRVEIVLVTWAILNLIFPPYHHRLSDSMLSLKNQFHKA